MTEPPKDRPTTVLVAEDEEGTRKFLCAALRAEGYTVLEAENGGAAERAAGRFGVPVDLLVTDYVMPDFDGHELARRLRERFPHLKVLIVSGHIEEESVQKGVLEETFKRGAAFLQKPFDAEDLARKVRAVLLTQRPASTAPGGAGPSPPGGAAGER
ncbi:MAG: response regulator [Planctomycetaceae bacterium]|nr:response regulator [Planctomycetota bacterium]NUN52408.1 response regulator [Planctomycetaceae bacterium]